MSHSSTISRSCGVLKLLKWLVENPQCKSLGNAKNVSVDPTLRILQNELYFSLYHVIYILCVLDTLTVVSQISAWAHGARLSLEIYMQGLNRKWRQ